MSENLALKLHLNKTPPLQVVEVTKSFNWEDKLIREVNREQLTFDDAKSLREYINMLSQVNEKYKRDARKQKKECYYTKYIQL